MANLNSLPNRSDKDDHILIKTSNSIRSGFPGDSPSNSISVTDTKQEKLAKLARTLIAKISANSEEPEANTTPQVITVGSGVVTLDSSVSPNATVELNEDVTSFSVTNASIGDSGLIEVKQDSTGSWTWVISGSELVLSGDLADIASITPTTGVLTVGWYKFGAGTSDAYIFVSSAT